MLKINDLKSLYLGVQGENLARTLQIDMSDWLSESPNAAVSIWHRINGAQEPTATAALLDLKTGILTWSPTSSDTAHDGQGEAEIRLTENGVIKKTVKIQTLTSPSVTLNGSALGSGWQQYINAIEALKNETVAAKNRAEKIVKDVADVVAADLLDDTAGAGNKLKAWSADKLTAELAEKAGAEDTEAALAERTKFTDVYAGCEEYDPVTPVATFLYGTWYHEKGSRYICTPVYEWGYTPPAGTYHLPEVSNENWNVFNIATMVKANHEGIEAAEEAAETALAAARAAAGAAVALYIDEDGDLCQTYSEI